MNKFFVIWKKYGMWALLIILTAVFCIVSPDKFMTKTVFENILKQASVIGICAVGATFIMITGNTDISVGPRVALTAIICGKLLMAGVSIPLVVLCGILVGMITGAINAILAEALHTYVFVITVATMNIWNGANYVITKGVTVSGLPAGFKNISQYEVFGVIPSIVIIFLVMAAIGHFILSRTYFGRYVYALGGNREAAHLAGVDVVKCNILTHAIAGIFIGVGGVVILSRTMTAATTLGATYSFDCITAACLGGVMLGGGRGRAIDAVLGVLVINVLLNGLTILGVGTYWQQIIKGGILVFAIALEVLQRMSRPTATSANEGKSRPEAEKQAAKNA